MSTKKLVSLLGIVMLLGVIAVTYNQHTVQEAQAQPVIIDRTYTFPTDFAQGVKVNVTTDASAMKLVDDLTTFPFIWIALSGRGTVVKVNTENGVILGEYKTAPDNMGKNPSRTTVDLKGNVWVTNRDEAQGSLGSVVHVGLKENSQCVDRNGNGQIDTSTGLGDVKAWTNAGGVNTSGGISTAADECIIHYVRVNALGTRHLSVDKNNNVWVGGNNNFGDGNRRFAYVDGNSGQVLKAAGPFACGGYGGLIDRNGIMWSAGEGKRELLRYDPSTNTGKCIPLGLHSYGLGIDSQGNIWNAHWGDQKISKISPQGVSLGVFSSGGDLSRGVAVTPADDNIWIANSASNTVTRLDNNGKLLATIKVGTTPTGVAVDAKGKVWVTNLDSNNTMRINPTNNTIEQTVDLGANSAPYNYSDMTGAIVLGNTAPQGTWTIIEDSGTAGTAWDNVSWVSQTDNGSQVLVQVRVADSAVGLGGVQFLPVTNGVAVPLPNGRFIQIEVKLLPGPTGQSPFVTNVRVKSKNANTCKLVQNKTAAPKTVYVGAAVTVTLSLSAVGQCDAASSPIDALLVLDRSGSMSSDRKLQKAQEAAKQFVAQLSGADQVGIASFASTNDGKLNQALTSNKDLANQAIDSLKASGSTNIKEGLEIAEKALANHQANHAPVIILLSDGIHNETAVAELATAATRIKKAGVRIITIGLGNQVDEKQLKQIASSTDDYYYAPLPDDLNKIYAKIAPTTRVAARDMELVDTLSDYVDLVPNTFGGPVQPDSVQGKKITWKISAIPADKPFELSYQVSVSALPGTWPTNLSATATYTDPVGNSSTLVFPIPEVTVPLVCEQPAVTSIEPGWICEGQIAQNLVISGTSFFAPTGPVSGTFKLSAKVDGQDVTIASNTKNIINGGLKAAIPVGAHNVTVVNTCAITDVVPVTSANPNAPAQPQIPTLVFSHTLVGGFQVYPKPKVLHIRPAEGYETVPSEITICGEGFDPPGTKAFLVIDGQEIDLNSQTFGNKCIVGNVPSNSADPRIKPGTHEVVVKGTCGEARGKYTILSDSLNDDLWSPELWIAGQGQGGASDVSGICVKLSDEISLGVIVNRRGGKAPIQDLPVIFYENDPTGLNPIKIGDGKVPFVPVRVGPTERISGTSSTAVRWRPTKTGEYTIYAVIDPPGNGSVTEDIETNNIISRTVRVLPPVDQLPGKDGVAPVASSFNLNRGSDIALQQAITMEVNIEDFAQPGSTATGVYSLSVVEVLYNEAAGVWVPTQWSGWQDVKIPGKIITQTLAWTLAPKGGIRYLQIWSTDKAGNVSRYPYQKPVSYLGGCKDQRVSKDGTVQFRRVLTKGDIIDASLIPCSGDADLYIWPPDWSGGRPPFVSNLAGSKVADATQTGGYAVPVSGVWTFEVYGYTNADFSLSIDVAAGSPARLAALSTPRDNLDPSKPVRNAPALPTDSVPSITMGVLPPAGPSPSGNSTYLPLIVK